jgi:hypothetical protein
MPIEHALDIRATKHDISKSPQKKTNATQTGSNTTHTGSKISGKYFDRVVIIVMENQDYDVAMKDKYIKNLANEYKGKLLTKYLATTHPSQPNYVSPYLVIRFQKMQVFNNPLELSLFYYYLDCPN